MKCLFSAALLAGALCATFLSPARAALTLDDALLILGEEVLQPSSATNAVNVLMTPAPLFGGVVEPMFGAPPSIDIATINGGNAQWFAFVDLEPCAFFEHDVIYVFIDDVTGAVTTNAATDWPQIDGVEFSDGAVPGEKLIRIHGLISEPFATSATQSLAAVTADYGDAPDGEAGARFPTLYDTTNSSFGANGGHATPDNFALGNGASIETDAADPTDSDSAPNLNDADSDERLFIIFDPNPPTPTGRLLFDAVSVSNETAVLNMLADINRDGTWSNASGTVEWVIANEIYSLSAGTNTYLSGTFPWYGGVDDLEGLWARLALTEASINPAPYGSAGWDGSGYIGMGEIEDVVIQKCPSGGGGGGPEFEDPKKTPPPGELFGWSDLPINYHALVIQGPDHHPQTAAAEAGETMYQILKAQGFNTPPIINGANATVANIAAEITKIKANVVCQDSILIYFVAHGKKNTPGGQMALAEDYTGADLDAALDLIPPCAGEECDKPGTCCNVSVIIESCYSGQFISSSAGTGRGVFTASATNEPAHFGSDGTGGAYSDGYATGAKPGSGADTSPADGIVTPEELHNHAAGKTKKQKEQKSQAYCDCVCPTNTWDCVRSTGGEGIAFPGGFGFNGAPMGDSFGVPIPLLPGMDPEYDLVTLDTSGFPFPNEWVFGMEIFNSDFMQTNQFQVFVSGVDTNTELVVPLPIWVGDPIFLPPQPFQLQIDLFLDQFQIVDSGGTNRLNGAWSNYPNLLGQPTSPFAPAGIERANFLPPNPIEIEIEQLNLQSIEPIVVLTWPAQQNSLYDVFVTEDLPDQPFVPLETNLPNNALLVPADSQVKIFKVESIELP